MYLLTGNFAKFILRIFGRTKIYHKDRLPKDTGFVVACTHIGWVDVVALGVSLLPRPIHFMAKKELFSKKLAGDFLRSINAFPVDRENPGPSSIKTPVKLLKDNQIVGIFPSGTRTSEDVPLKRGAVTIANLAKVPIVPAAYLGPTNLKELLSGKQIKIIFGDPIPLHTNEGNKKELSHLTEELTKVMVELGEEVKKRK